MTLVLIIVVIAMFLTVGIMRITEEPSSSIEEKALAVARKEFRIDWVIGVSLAFFVLAFTTKAMFGIVFINFGYLAAAFFFGWSLRAIYVFGYNMFQKARRKMSSV